MSTYYVPHDQTTPVEPRAGWYRSTEDDPVGPFDTRNAALLDHEREAIECAAEMAADAAKEARLIRSISPDALVQMLERV